MTIAIGLVLAFTIGVLVGIAIEATCARIDARMMERFLEDQRRRQEGASDIELARRRRGIA